VDAKSRSSPIRARQLRAGRSKSVRGTSRPGIRTLDRSYFQRPPAVVARELLGHLLVSQVGRARVAGRIVETEGYLAEGDSACHAARGRTPKTEVMFGPPGMAYVYPIHAKYCFNVVTEDVDHPSAVLIRAVEPIEGIRWMQRRRGFLDVRNLARGPARLCQAFSIDRSVNGLDLTLGQTVWIEPPSARIVRPGDVQVTRRVGVTSAHELKLRFVIAGSRFVSDLKKRR